MKTSHSLPDRMGSDGQRHLDICVRKVRRRRYTDNMHACARAGRRGRAQAGAGAGIRLASRALRRRRRADRRRRVLPRQRRALRPRAARSDVAWPEWTGDPADAAEASGAHAGSDPDGSRRHRRSRARPRPRRRRLSRQAVRAARAARAHPCVAAARPSGRDSALEGRRPRDGSRGAPGDPRRARRST